MPFAVLEHWYRYYPWTNRRRIFSVGAWISWRCCWMFKNYYRQEIIAYCKIRLRLCYQKWPQEGYLRSQSQYHETRWRFVLAKLWRGRFYIPFVCAKNSWQHFFRRSPNCIHVFNSRKWLLTTPLCNLYPTHIRYAFEFNVISRVCVFTNDLSNCLIVWRHGYTKFVR